MYGETLCDAIDNWGHMYLSSGFVMHECWADKLDKMGSEGQDLAKLGNEARGGSACTRAINTARRTLL